MSGVFDAVTYNHWLAFKNRCLEGSPQDSQALFEAVMKRARPEFMQIKPYGNIGDRKCDGLFRSDEIVFQVYSPDQLKLGNLRRKIDEDLDGAATHWADTMTKWVFVYNTRRGLSPDVPALLNEKQKQYPKITIGHISDDSLWEIARNELTVQQRAEILGAPTGHQGLVIDAAASESDVKSQIQRGWTVLYSSRCDVTDQSGFSEGSTSA